MSARFSRCSASFCYHGIPLFVSFLPSSEVVVVAAGLKKKKTYISPLNKLMNEVDDSLWGFIVSMWFRKVDWGIA